MDQPFIFISKTQDVYLYLHYEEVEYQMARLKNACGQGRELEMTMMFSHDAP